MRESGRVVAVEDGVASVLFRRSSMCAKCGACGIGAGQDDITVSVPNTLGARIGDAVTVQFTSRNALASSALGYVFPLLMMFVGIFVGYAVPQIGPLVPDAAAAIFGLAFTVAAFLVLRLLNPLFRKRFSNVYTMTEILPPQKH